MRGIGLGKKRLLLIPHSVSVFLEPGRAEGPSQRPGTCQQHRSRRWVEGNSWQPLRAGLSSLPCCHTRLLLMRAAPHASCTAIGNFFLVWQVKLLGWYMQGRTCFAFLGFFFVFFRINSCANEIKLRQKGCLHISSQEGLPCICHSSGLQFCPNAFNTTIKRLLVINYLALEFTRWLANSTLYFVLHRSGHACVGDSLALITL